FSEDCALSVNDYSQADINIYPNPVNDILYIENNEHIRTKKVTFYDVFGRVVFSEKNNFNQLNFSNLNSGILFVRIETEYGTITKKLIKE
ncbi:T9SS type A sorting domain-containing protein, partial [Flavobacteriaceae bacterium]|nr:T9SS type A sorting domain-containing protein [Flavobacteriaceae bacterium]